MEHPWGKAAEQIRTYFLDRFLVDPWASSRARVLQTLFSFVQRGSQNIRGQSALWDLNGQSYKELLVDIFKAFSLKVKWQLILLIEWSFISLLLNTLSNNILNLASYCHVFSFPFHNKTNNKLNSQLYKSATQYSIYCMQFFHLDSSITSNCNKKTQHIVLASITFWQIIIKLFLRSSAQCLRRRIILNNGANILTQLISYFSIEVYTTVISSSMGIISYKTEILQVFFWQLV